LKEKTKVENELKLARKGVLESIDENKNRIKGVQQEVTIVVFQFIPLTQPPCGI
jgi:hypothetical protein